MLARAPEKAALDSRKGLAMSFFTLTDGQHHWHQMGIRLVCLLGAPAIAVAGGMLASVIGPPKAFIFIMAMIIIWAVAGWFLGGWRAVLAGLAALTAALSAAYQNYLLATALSGLTILFLLFFSQFEIVFSQNSNVRAQTEPRLN